MPSHFLSKQRELTKTCHITTRRSPRDPTGCLLGHKPFMWSRFQASIPNKPQEASPAKTENTALKYSVVPQILKWEMAAKLSSPVAVPTAVPQFSGLKAQPSAMVKLPVRRTGSGALGARCDGFIGSSTNLIMVTTTSLMLFAGRFGLAPSANRKATAGLKLEVRDSGLQTGDPAGFTLADTLACGSVGHIMGVGIVLGLKNMGVL